MKTNTFSFQKLPLFSLIVVLSVLMTSCGSYQNSSYYGDGIYGDTGNQDRQRQESYDSNNHYKSYFSSLQDENQSQEIFTDIDSYNNYDSDTDNIDGSSNNYGGWGTNATQTDIAIYSNNYGMGWGPGYNNWRNPYLNNGFGYNLPYLDNGFGWLNPYYGAGYNWNSSFGLGFNGFGYGIFRLNSPFYGYNSYYGNPFYGTNRNDLHRYGNQIYSRNYSNNAGRRGSVNYNSNTNRNSNTQINRTYNGRSNSTYSRNGSFNSGTRTNTPIFRRGESQNRNSNSPTQGRTNNSQQQRSYTPTNNSTQNRTYTPSTNTGRSSSGSSSGRSSGGSSSGRSSGGR